MNKHTKGPWQVVIEQTDTDGVNVRFSISSDAAVGIATGQSQEHMASFSGAVLEAECIANAYLMAAAPTLLAALEAIQRAGVWPDIHQTVEDAIAAAKGPCNFDEDYS